MPDLSIHLDALGLRRGGFLALTRGGVALEPRELVAGDGLQITNPSGANGAPTFSARFATQAEQEAGAETAMAVSPAMQHHHPSAAKFWAYINSSSLDASYNVTSITDNGTNITVTIATDFSSSNWCALPGTLTGQDRFAKITAKTAGSVTIASWDVSSAAEVTANTVILFVAGFGDQ